MIEYFGMAILRKQPILRIIRYCITTLIAFFLPVWLYFLNTPWVYYTDNKDQSIFEYMAFSIILFIFFNGWVELRGRWPLSNHERYGWIMGGLLLVFYAVLFREFSKPNWDFQAYQNAARAIQAGLNPYLTDPPYLYPPLVAEILLLAFQGVNWIALHIFQRGLSADQASLLVFYGYQSLQYMAILCCAWLTYQFSRKLYLSQNSSLAITLIFFMVSTPTLSSFVHNQVNFWILISIYLVIMTLDRWPILAGVGLSLGFLIKLYPVLLGVAWVLKRSFKAIFSAILCTGVVVGIELVIGKGLILWPQFFDNLVHFNKIVALRDNSISGFTYHIGLILFPDGGNTLNLTSRILMILCSCFVVGWMMIRMTRRMRSIQLSSKDKFLGNCMDIILLMLLISPLVWEHHYVFAIPVMVWVIANQPKRLFGMAGLALVLIFLIPTFDIFFFSYHRLAGIILLILITPPEAMKEPEKEVDLFQKIPVKVSNESI